jgi:hypothetical protein
MSTPFNPQLATWRHAKPEPEAGKGQIFLPGTETNLRWQNRVAEPRDYERKLAAAVVTIYAEGSASTPEAFAKRLTVLMPDFSWTAASVEAEFARLGA